MEANNLFYGSGGWGGVHSGLVKAFSQEAGIKDQDRLYLLLGIGFCAGETSAIRTKSLFNRRLSNEYGPSHQVLHHFCSSNHPICNSSSIPNSGFPDYSFVERLYGLSAGPALYVSPSLHQEQGDLLNYYYNNSLWSDHLSFSVCGYSAAG